MIVAVFSRRFSLEESDYSHGFPSVFSRRFSTKGKMPDYSSDLFFLFFFRLQSSHWKVHFSYNSYLANLKYWRKSLRSSIFTSSKKLKVTKGYCLRVFSALWDFFSIKKIPKGSPLQFVWSFPTERMLKNPKGPSFQFFRHCETFFQKIFFTKSDPPIFFDLRQNGWKISKCPLWCANSVQLLGFSGTVEEITLTLWSPFAVFEL